MANNSALLLIHKFKLKRWVDSEVRLHGAEHNLHVKTSFIEHLLVACCARTNKLRVLHEQVEQILCAH